MVSPSRIPSVLATLPTRAATAITLGAIIIAAILFGGPYALALCLAVVSAFATVEFYAITRREHRTPNDLLGVVAASLLPFAAAAQGTRGMLMVVVVLGVLALLWHVVSRQIRLADTAVTVFGPIYTGGALAHFVLIDRLPGGTALALTAIISVWANDVAAYFVGSLFGSHKLAPRISPKKSWEGFIAGTIGTLIVWAIYAFVYPEAWKPLGLSTWVLALLSLGIAFASVTGDLFESRLKREAEIKDSGAALPGHGGFLDRFDSLILVSVVAYHILNQAAGS